jgi:hypothetical protein
LVAHVVPMWCAIGGTCGAHVVAHVVPLSG